MARAGDPGARVEEAGERVTGTHDETKWAPLTTEFWAMLLLIVAILIAAAVSDTLNDTRAWLLVTIIGAAYIVSRGLAKGGSDHTPFRRRGAGERERGRQRVAMSWSIREQPSIAEKGGTREP